MIYTSCKEDFYPRSWSKLEIDAQLQLIENKEIYLKVTEEGFCRISLIERIVNFIKGLLGGTDCSKYERIQSLMFKVLYFAEANDLLDQNHLYQLRGRIKYSPLSKSPIAQFFQKIDQFHIQGHDKSKHLKELRELVTHYHHKEALSLRPGFWGRLFTYPILNSKVLMEFGDTPLFLLNKALEQKKPDCHLAFEFLKRAFALKNDKPQFQVKLAVNLKKLEETYPELKNQAQKIEDLWIELGETAFKNKLSDLGKNYLKKAVTVDPSYFKGRVKIGKLYLMHHHDAEALQFLPEIQKASGNEPATLAQIGHVYWEEKKIPEAIAAYQAALKCSQNSSALIHYRIGKAYFDNLIPADTHSAANARKFLFTAFAKEPTNSVYEEELFNAYQKQWAVEPDQFIKITSDDFLKFLRRSQPSPAKKWGAKIILELSEKLFKLHLNNQAHQFLAEVLRLFPNDESLKIDVVDMALRYHDTEPLKEKMKHWITTNPYLKKKIGDAYWKSDTALQIYGEALDLFQKRIAITQDDNEKLKCQKWMGEIEAKFGQNYLQTPAGLFKGVPYDQALQHLEKATKHHSSHISVLFDAYLTTAEAEKKRNVLLRDTKKIIDWYQKAFDALPQKGEYLVDLMRLYLDANRGNEAVALYKKIEKQPWGASFELSADLWSRLGNCISDDERAALRCFKKAYLASPAEFKNEYFSHALNIAQKHIDDLERLEILKQCWDEGFDGVQKQEKPFGELLTNIYSSLAKSTLETCLIKGSSRKIPYSEIHEHTEKYKKEFDQVLEYLNEGLKVNPKSEKLHFEKGLFLTKWFPTQLDEAHNAFEQAVKIQGRNPYYQWFLGDSFFIKNNSENKAKHHKLAQNLAQKGNYESFMNDRLIFDSELRFKEKTKQIDPHAYIVPKGWLG